MLFRYKGFYEKVCQYEEYGEEFAEETEMPEAEVVDEVQNGETQHDGSELQYITPIDYAKRIAEMDEDLRDALEILVSECSCYTPFKPFLQDIVASEYLFMPNKLDFLSEVVLDGKDSRSAFANNQYGLVQYTLKPYEIEVNYKNRFGERVKETTGYRELYEVLTYMVKTPYYCGVDQREYFDKMMQGDNPARKPIYQEFLDKQAEIKANREATKERAIANGWESADVQEETTAELHTAIPTEMQSASKMEKTNFHYNPAELPKGGAKTRFKWNVDAIRTLKEIEAEGRLATREEQKVLSNYVGWGGLAQAFDERNASWEKEYESGW